MIERALLSVYDKTGLEELCRGLAALGVELVASGGTAAYLEEMAIDVTRVEELTEVPELLGGRVKTLHPRVHAGILARRDVEADLTALAEHDIPAFDLVCVNLYPFARRREVEMIDVGGPAMLRAAAKNWADVAALSRPEQYAGVLAELRETGAVSEATRRRLAADAFALTAAYDADVAAWLADDAFADTLTISAEKVADLSYGENPHQRAAHYAAHGRGGGLLAASEQLHGKPLSFNNVTDLVAARRLLRELDGPACVIVKHGNPCGVAVAPTAEESYERALACDPLSAFGGVIACDRPVGRSLAAALAQQFVEVLEAPAYEPEALAVLTEKPAIRILRTSQDADEHEPLEYRPVPGGLLVQEPDAGVATREGMELVCGSLSDTQWDDLLFAWRVCKHVSSNAIVIARDGQAIGIGAGQQSRVDAVRLAVEKARDRGHDLAGAVLASDAFFPFADGPGLALAAGVHAVIQPGGSKRDADVIAAVEAAGAAMVFTGRRHFRH